MSIGYMPKKLKNARRQKRMRKKYQNFSCKTCSKASYCKIRLVPTPPIGVAIFNREFCPEWVASWRAKHPARVVTLSNQPKKKKSLKEIFKDIF